MIVFKKDHQRNDYEVIDQSGKCHGFIWPYDDHWVCRVGERPAENYETYELAVTRAKELVNEALQKTAS